MKQYQLFAMLPSESITEMFTRFSDITNPLCSLGKKLTTEEMVQKILSSLPPQWNAKTTAIEEANDVSNISMEELIGKLMAHEVHMKSQEDDSSKKKGVAFKADSDSDISNDTVSDSDIALLTNKFRRFLRKKQVNRFENKYKRKEIKEDSVEVRCYKCKKLGHIRKNCPEVSKDKKKEKYEKKPKKYFKKKKALQATWGDSESSDESSSESDKSESADVAFMAKENEVNDQTDVNSFITTSFTSTHDDVAYLDLLNSFNDLFEECKDHILKVKQLKKENESLKEKLDTVLEENETIYDEYDIFKDEFDLIKSENANLKKRLESNKSIPNNFSIYKLRIEELEKTNESLKDQNIKFMNSGNKIEMPKPNTNNNFIKPGIGFVKRNDLKTNFQNTLPKHTNTFRKLIPSQTSQPKSTITCYFCNKQGHHIKRCRFRKN